MKTTHHKQNHPAGHQQEKEEGKAGGPLEEFTVNFAKRAAEGGIDPLIGRDRELQRMMQVLCRRKK